MSNLNAVVFFLYESKNLFAIEMFLNNSLLIWNSFCCLINRLLISTISCIYVAVIASELQKYNKRTVNSRIKLNIPFLFIINSYSFI